MNKDFTKDAFDDYNYLKKYEPKLYKKMWELLRDIEKHPFYGLGKPEALKKNYSGYWSRRINQEHRLVYKVVDDCIIVVSCRYHYTNSNKSQEIFNA